MNLLPVAEYLAAKDIGVRTTGTNRNTFVYQMPETVTNGVLLRQRDGGTLIDHYLPGFYKTSFQVVVRTADVLQGMALAERIAQALNVYATQMGDMKVKHVRPQHEPYSFPSSQGNLTEIAVMFDICFTVS